MISFRLRANWQKSRGYVPCYERTPKNGWFDIHSVFATHVETVCLLSKLHEAKHHVSVKLDMDEMDLSSAESKATYEEIKAYVAEHNDGMKVSSLNLAQVKRNCGLELAENFNLPKIENYRQPQCPKKKEEAYYKGFASYPDDMKLIGGNDGYRTLEISSSCEIHIKEGQ